MSYKEIQLSGTKEDIRENIRQIQELGDGLEVLLSNYSENNNSFWKQKVRKEPIMATYHAVLKMPEGISTIPIAFGVRIDVKKDNVDYGTYSFKTEEGSGDAIKAFKKTTEKLCKTKNIDTNLRNSDEDCVEYGNSVLTGTLTGSLYSITIIRNEIMNNEFQIPIETEKLTAYRRVDSTSIDDSLNKFSNIESQR